MSGVEVFAAAIVAKFLFFPVKGIVYDPSQLQIPYEEVRFKNSGGQNLHGWFFPGQKTKTLLYLHGNAGNIGDRLDKIRILKRTGCNIFIFDYRGYGNSEGSPTIEGVLQDSGVALRYLRENRQTPKEQIILFGESLGGAMAVDLASREPVGGVILESTFTSLRDMSRSAYPFVPGAAVPDAYRSIDLIRKLKSPLLVIHGTEDEIVPFEMGKKLFEAAPQPKRFYPIPGAHHNDPYLIGRSEYLKQIEGFLSETGLP